MFIVIIEANEIFEMNRILKNFSFFICKVYMITYKLYVTIYETYVAMYETYVIIYKEYVIFLIH